jgi:glyoxylase-like metal-dependent hydrolase (beta-lactamase superfamily II)
VSGHVLPLAGSSEPWTGGPVTASATCVLAPNPSPWTLDGTNTWLLTAPGSDRAVVVDPGPDHAGHQAQIRHRANERDVRITHVLLTHGHVDHAAGARSFAEGLGVGVRALDPDHRLGDEGLVDGDVVDVGGWSVHVVGTPGHSHDSVSFLLPHDAAVLTGDTVLGRGTSLVAWPDGLLGDYLDSLRRLRDLTDESSVERLLPGHGPVLSSPGAVIDAYLAHRQARLEEVRAVVDSGVTDAPQIVAIVYSDVPREVWPAAELTVRAQLAFLEES